MPVAALLKQYKENDNNLVRHFDLLYIQQGIDRLPLEAGHSESLFTCLPVVVIFFLGPPTTPPSTDPRYFGKCNCFPCSHGKLVQSSPSFVA